jgi:CubicO group peptidase (beta-lactamase class C family)
MSTAPPEPALVRDVLDACARRVGVAGAQLTVVTPGGRTDAVWGRSHRGRALTRSMRVQVGSIAKVLTAVLVHQLVDDGLVSLSDSAADVTPGLPAGVRIGQLLSMTSGLDEGIWAAGRSVTDALRPQWDLPPRADPGSFGYSMASTLVAARVVELLRGSSWWDTVLDRIARPLGLGLTDIADTPGWIPSGTGRIPTAWTAIEAPPLTGMGPTGTTLCASAGDLATIAVALADPDGPLLSPSSHAALHRPVVEIGTHMCADAWCHGPYARRSGERLLHGHGGRWAGGVSDLTWQAGTGTAVAIVTDTPARGAALIREVSREIHPLVWGAAAFVDPRPVPAADLDGLTGSYATATRDFDVRRRGERLVLRVRSRPHPAAVFQLPDSDVELVPVGVRRFLPAHETTDERRLQEVWFSAEPVPEHCYDGFVAARRAASATTAASADGS